MPPKYFIFCCILFLSFTVRGQTRDSINSPVVTYEEVLDNPYAINKLWIHLQPLYGELFVTNVNVGFGVQVDYQAGEKLGLTAQWRRAYAKATDFAREVAQKNQDNFDNNKAFNYLQFGGTIHLSDKPKEATSTIIMYSQRYRGKRWANRIPQKLPVPSQLRKIVGLRWGGFLYNSTTDATRAAMEQGVVLTGLNSTPLPDAKLYANVEVKALYLGASLHWLRNIAIKPHRDFGVLVNDFNFNAFVDIIYAPSVEVEDMILGADRINGDQLSTQELGFRAGVEGKFNKRIGYSYGAEIGYRPSLEERSFYAMFRLGFPVFGVPPQNQPRLYR